MDEESLGEIAKISIYWLISSEILKCRMLPVA